MDKYRKIQCVRGLIVSLDEQLARYDQNKQMTQDLEKKIINHYFDAILEQLEQSKDENQKKFILTSKKRGIISEEQKIELLNQSEKKKEDCPVLFEFNILVNGKRHIVHTTEDRTINWEKVVSLSELAKTGNEILSITYSGGDTSNQAYATCMLEINKSIKIKEGMIFNVCNTSKA